MKFYKETSCWLITCVGLAVMILSCAAAPYDDNAWLHRKKMMVYAPMMLSPDGAWLTVTWQGLVESDAGSGEKTLPSEKSATDLVDPDVEGDEVLVVETATGKITRPFKKFTSSYFPVWSPDGKSLALLVEEGVNRDPRVAVWTPASDQVRVFPAARAQYILMGFSQLRWSNDSKYILFPALSNDGNETPLLPLVVVKSTTGQQKGAGNGPYGWPGIVDVQSGQLTLLKAPRSTDPSSAEFSPDDRQVAYLRVAPTQAGQANNYWNQLVVANLKDGSDTVIGEPHPDNWGYTLSWSPDGKNVAWHPSNLQGPDALFVGNVAQGTMKECPLPKDAAAGDLHAKDTYPLSLPLWSKDSQTFLVPGKDALLRFDINGVAQGQIPLPPTQPPSGTDWLVPAIPSRHGPVWPQDGKLLVLRRGEIDQVGLTGGETKQLTHWSGVAGDNLSNDGWYERAFDAATQMLYTLKINANSEIDLMKTHLPDATTSKVCTIYEGIAPIDYGTTRFLTWKLADGKECGGTLLLPVGWKEGDKPPVVMEVYGAESGQGHRSAEQMGSHSYILNPNFLSLRGYAFFVADLPQTDDEPAMSLVRSTEAAVDALRLSGLADTDRIAIQGNSYGGYTVLELLTHSKEFKAGIVSDGFYDLLRDSTDGEFAYNESGQGGMHATLWENTQKYIDNSPLYALPQLNDPLLILQGANDPLGSGAQSPPLFNSLQRLGKPAEMLVYRGGAHWPMEWPIDDQLDMHRRLLEFLDEHLKTADVHYTEHQ